MSVVPLLWREIQHRKLNFAAALLAVVAAVAVCVAVVTLCDASQRETTRLMRNLGFNVLIVPKNVNMADFWSEDFAREEMPEEYVHRLAQSRDMSVRHLVARLQKKIEWRGRVVLLTGILPEVPMAHGPQKDPMGLDLPRGTAYVGYQLARVLRIKAGDTIEIGGKALRVTRLLDEKGGKDDIRIYAHLHDVQEILGKPGWINEIEALGCLCAGGDGIERIRAELARALPDTQVTEFESIARARSETRFMVERYAAFLIPTVLVACGLWVFLLALSNVRERRVEIGLLRSLGVRSGSIAGLFLGKAALVGLLGALVGYGLGTWVALHFGPRIFPVTAKSFAPLPALLGWALLVAPLLCIVASYLPAMLAVTQDPAEVLREE